MTQWAPQYVVFSTVSSPDAITGIAPPGLSS
jgi:hypothetical protein